MRGMELVLRLGGMSLHWPRLIRRKTAPPGAALLWASPCKAPRDCAEHILRRHVRAQAEQQQLGQRRQQLRGGAQGGQAVTARRPRARARGGPRGCALDRL